MITKQELIEKFKNKKDEYKGCFNNWQEAIELAQQLPDSERGECEIKKVNIDFPRDVKIALMRFRCSKCAHHFEEHCYNSSHNARAKYCPNCGAKIKRGGE